MPLHELFPHCVFRAIFNAFFVLSYMIRFREIFVSYNFFVKLSVT